MDECDPSILERKTQLGSEIEYAEDVAITSATFGVIFEVLSRYEGFPELVQRADRITAAAAGAVAVGALSKSIYHRVQRRSLKEQPPLA